MADLIGIQIKDLFTAGAINATTELPVQRTGVTKAEKISLTNLTNYILTSTEFTTNLNTSINSKINVHVTASDPHGDRAHASSLLSAHTSATDPHGDRSFATSSTNTAIATHVSASDPHGDRVYTNTQISTHIAASDPHGDRAFATTAANGAVTTSNTYTDNKVSTEFTTRIGTTIAPLSSGKVPDTHINKELSFSSFSGFPATGLVNRLYIDTSNNDVYYWNGSSYINMTPAVNIGELSLTTNDVTPGSDLDRQYLTAAKNTTFTNKVSDVLSETTADTTSVFSRKTSNVVYLKNINTDGYIRTSNDATTISLFDYNYKYNATGTGNVTLALTSAIRTDPLQGYSDTNVYRIKGEVFVYCTTDSSGSTIVTENNVFNVDARVALTGVTQPVPAVTTATIDDTGASLSGTALANSTLEIYDNTYTLITTRPINALGNFSHTFSPARDEGEPIYLYVKTPSNERSSRYTLYTPNTNALENITGVSISGDGLTVKGKAERLVTVELFDATPTSLGTATADSNGYFSITLSTALVDAATFTIESENALGTISDTYTGTADLNPTIAAYEVSINNARTSVSGKGHPDGSVSIYDNTDTLLITLPINSSGAFSGVLPSGASTLDEFRFIVEESSNLSQTVILLLPPALTLQTPPNVIPILVDSVYDFIYKDTNKRINNTNFEFNVEVDIPNSDILLKGTNNLGKDAKWEANLHIVVEEI